MDNFSFELEGLAGSDEVSARVVESFHRGSVNHKLELSMSRSSRMERGAMLSMLESPHGLWWSCVTETGRKLQLHWFLGGDK